jgi:hypothetical protein
MVSKLDTVFWYLSGRPFADKGALNAEAIGDATDASAIELEAGS